MTQVNGRGFVSFWNGHMLSRFIRLVPLFNVTLMIPPTLSFPTPRFLARLRNKMSTWLVYLSPYASLFRTLSDRKCG